MHVKSILTSRSVRDADWEGVNTTTTSAMARISLGSPMCKAAVSAGLTGSSAPKVGREGKHVKKYSVHGCIDWMLWFF